MLRKAAETDVHAAGFGTKIGGLRPSDASQGFFDSLGGRDFDSLPLLFYSFKGKRFKKAASAGQKA